MTTTMTVDSNEIISLRQEMDSLREQLITLTDDNNFLRKKNSSLQQEITNDHNEYARIETELYNQGHEVERLKKENVGFLKNKREVERKLREETQAFEKDRITWQERESELIDQVKALQETINVIAQHENAQKKISQPNLRDDNNNLSAGQQVFDLESDNSATITNGSGYIFNREVRTAQRTIKELERRLNELTTEIENAKQATTESMNLNKIHARRIHSLETELSQEKNLSRTLREDIEGYQLLLHEKTMKDDETEVDNKDNPSIIKKKSLSNDLEAELNRASTLRETLLGERVYKESDHTVIEKLLDEIKSLKDANKSMALYIEKILNRIMEAQSEELLSTDWSAKVAASSPTSPTSGGFPFSDNINASSPKKKERRKTVSGPFNGHFRSTSQPLSTFSPQKDKIITEEPEPNASSGNKKQNDGKLKVDTLSPPTESTQRTNQRRNSTSTRNSKRFSIFGWGSKEDKKEDKKEDESIQENQVN
ncbi:8905_t:CDS:2 [Diversispora eburnea]|uniref:8905_t:CDS:1 n=1 Tax=Diversispora eburnea TaxID=1213867 RepID=A0A9N8W065_9GLOM|nr:8905_t:CDS:2 [Diversispora eburnea]